MDTTPFNHRILKILLTGIRRRKAHLAKQALPVTPRILQDINARLVCHSAKDQVFWALCLLAFFTMCRKSNLVPNSAAQYNPAKHLSRVDIEVTPRGLLITVGWSKTIQFGQRRLVILVVRIPGSLLCPVRAYRTMCHSIPASDSAPAFLIPENGQLRPLTYRMWMSRLRGILTQTGRNASKFSCHSFRRGGASFAFKAGVPSELVKLLGDWRSNCYLRYLHFPLESKTQAAQSMATYLTHGPFA